MRDKPLILIGDDEPGVVRALARLLRAAGFDVVGETDASRILQHARSLRPDLIVLDIRQHLDGRDLLSALKKDEATREIAVVMLSGVEDQFTRITCLELGAVDYAVKPFDLAFANKLKRLAMGPRGGSTEPRPAGAWV